MGRPDERGPGLVTTDVYRKRVFSADIAIGDVVREVFCLARVERRAKKNGEAFLSLTLVDCSGRIPAVAWDDVEALAEVLVEGGYARIEGRVGDFRGEPQVTIEGATLPEGPLDPAEYLPRGPVPGEHSLAGIREIVATLRDPHLAALLSSLLDDPRFSRAFATAPAAMTNHHAYVGGLAEHTLNVMRLCASAAEQYADLDRDLLLAGAFCHDIGKTREIGVEPGFPYTEEGMLIGHIPLGYALVREGIAAIDGFPEARATDLGHLILSHQGELEWGSPVRPRTLEALVLHFLDNLDSKVGSARVHLSGIDGGRTGYVKALGRSLFQRPPASPPEGAAEPRPEPSARTSGGPNPPDPAGSSDTARDLDLFGK